MRNLSVLDKKYPYYVIYKAISAWLVEIVQLARPLQYQNRTEKSEYNRR